MPQSHYTIIGAGNIGLAIANGLVANSTCTPGQLTLTRRHLRALKPYAEKGFHITSDNSAAVQQSDVVLIAVEPSQIDSVLREIAPALQPEKHIVISVVTGVTIAHMKRLLQKELPVVRAMPNTAISIGRSMTCLAGAPAYESALEKARLLFDAVGKTLNIDEELMGPATALAACGLAFFMRAIRAASQGGVEIGFHADDALLIAAQTAAGAAGLLLEHKTHPEREIDRVTTPRGVTIAGLNQMEHDGFSSAMIRGIVTSATKAEKLYKTD
ncbi:MAG: pyrroline-5-carboxylate reductase [Calditrichaeota bacterium]|nr:MAG: pyrroline-5-carboxylate reductase [Calditrichota bacterium]